MNTIVGMCREWIESLGGDGGDGCVAGGGRVLPMPLVVEIVIFGFRKNTLGANYFCL